MRYFILLFSSIFFSALQGYAQKISYSDVLNNETISMDFSIIGKQGNNYLIYKNYRKKNYISVYGPSMQMIKNYPLDKIPDKIYGYDFISYADGVIMFYQYRKGRTVYSAALKIDNEGKPITDPYILDETKISNAVDSKVYSVAVSENKNLLLLYKILKKGNTVSLSTFTFNQALELTKNTLDILNYQERQNIFSDIAVNNSGDFIIAKLTRKPNRESAYAMEIFSRRTSDTAGMSVNIPLNEKLVDEVFIKSDNINQRFLLNTMFADDKSNNFQGVFSVLYPFNEKDSILSAFNSFPDSLRNSFTSSGNAKKAFQNTYLQNIIIKNDGGFIISAEDQTTTVSNNYYRRRDNLYNDYYYNYPYYNYGRYTPYNNFYRSTQFNYDNVLICSVDRNLDPEWNRILLKRQQELESANLLSYLIMNTGGMLHFIYAENEKSSQIINNIAISSDGDIKRFPNFKNTNEAYKFVPNSGKQVAYNKIILPCIYKSYLIFALVEFAQ